MSELTKVHRRDLLSTGSTLLNLACSGNPFGGFLRGHYYFIVGDSASGKTFLSMTCFAEATISKHFKDHRLIYDNAEDGCLLNIDQLFSEAVADRIEAPSENANGPAYSTTIEEFYYHLDDAFKAGKPFIYVLDSMDAIDSEAAEKKFQEHKKAHRKKQHDDGDGKKVEKVTGSYGTEKARKNSENLRGVIKRLRDTGSVLIIVSQTRDSMGYGKTRSGGRALRFYATVEFWSSIVEKIKKTVRGKQREVGVRVQLQMRKNRITGKTPSVEVDIYPSVGIDDLGSMVDYLVEEGFWSKGKETITTKGLGQTMIGTREKVIRTIEAKGLENKLRELCGECWDQIDQACAIVRKNKYRVEP